MPKSDIPFGSEFGPNQVDLATVLRLAAEYAGNGAAFTRAIAARYGWPEETAKNTRLGLHGYELVQDDTLTEIGERLLSLADDPPAMYEAFARHILLNLHGLEVVTAVDDMRRVGERVNLITISRYLKPLGLYVPPTGTHLSKLRGWLGQAGVFTTERGFDSLDMGRVRALIGIADDSELDVLAEMPEDQRSFLKALANLPMPSIPDEAPIRASEVLDYATTLYGTTFNEKGIVRATLTPLQDAGYITIDKPPKATGDEAGARKQISGKSTLIYRTEKFANECLLPLVDALAGTGLAVRQLLRKPLSEILSELQSDDRNVKGKALEALAFYLMRLLDLEFRSWYRRGKDTNGVKVEAVADEARLVYRRWQILCTNAERVTDDDVAVELGLTPILHPNVVLIVANGSLTEDARQLITATRQSYGLDIIAVEREQLRFLAHSPGEVSTILNARGALSARV